MSVHTEHTATPLYFDEIRERVLTRLTTFLTGKRDAAAGRGLVPEIPEMIRGFVTAGGKRLRPMLCSAGWRSAGGAGLPDVVVDVAAALEMYQTFALIHDDVIDGSATRRSQPTVHRSIAARYPQVYDERRFGEAAAILIGDMALMWSTELLTSAALPAGCRSAVRALVDTMREEMHYGQYLDLFTSLGSVDDHRTPMTVIRYKTAKYTVERPLQLGALLAGADAAHLDLLSRFALPLGDAFQLRDDLLGLFGNSSTTGKPVFDDLREGKHTVLLALAAQRADTAGRALLERHLGDPALTEQDAIRVMDVIEGTRAPVIVEDMIADRHAEALAVLDTSSLPAEVTAELRLIGALLVERDS
ncbi:polyprenyl synthetase family protein [Amycolatopsis sp. WAC 04197]|uniref:polyprenyl synthetase family protein n=1 Tax=Amycolatopsis sp. WAC 04197 TaxID=2203199 RepID=UPI000F79F09E|nr:polyprenyl synthetase family protein [Amycolatopsis sp. WAC 04197]